MYKVQLILGNRAYTSGHYENLLDAIAFMKKLQENAYNATIKPLHSTRKSSVMKFDDDNYIACYVSFKDVKEYRVVYCKNNATYKITLNLNYEKED